MRSSLRNKRSRIHPTADAQQYCAFCATVMPFESIDPADYPTDEPAEWICTKCGSALLVDPPTQDLHHTA